MRTLLSQFCDEFEAAVRPILDPLQRAGAALSNAPSALSARAVLPDLMEVRHQLAALTDKVAEQQAYVLIFGPLKSGKSTLMNAMSAAYVSEVTCLPAYPCMVYVSHGDEARYEVESYDGTIRSFDDPSALRLEIDQAHATLAETIRAHGSRTGDGEASAETFDPASHCPSAIRKVEVKVPAPSLKHSGAVLVDTPGLYSRMKFGYDRMTRDFRNAAACAIFVVKTDNLFLEQVFDEFVELLELFSRIFLVVNLDSTKQDLRPDGTLAPSLELADPGKVIEAFSDLTMSAPLKRAVEDGRLGIYPVDLLQSASGRIRGRDDDPGFGTFVTELTEYLNSTDYMVSFLGDSLRRGRSLFEDIGAISRDPSVEKLARDVAELRAGLTLAREQAETLERVEQHAWTDTLRGLRDELVDGSRTPSAKTRDDINTAVDEACERWFETDQSLQELLSDTLEDLFNGSRRDLSESIRTLLGERVRMGAAGLTVPDALVRDLHTAGVSLDRVGRTAVAELAPDPGEPSAPVTVDLEQLPVKKGLWDWLLLRSQSKVRQRIFGTADAPSKVISAAVKTRRLGTAAKDALRGQLDNYLEASFRRDVDQVSQRLFESYSSAVEGALRLEVADKRKLNTQRLHEFTDRLGTLEDVKQSLDELSIQGERVSSTLAGLDGRYGETESDLLIQPVPPPAQSPQTETASLPSSTEETSSERSEFEQLEAREPIIEPSDL